MRSGRDLPGGKARVRVRLSRMEKRQEMTAYLFIAMPLLLFLVFMCYPLIKAFFLSFTSYDILRPAKWIGLQNYSRMLGDELFFKSLGNILYYVVMYVPAMIAASLGVALALNSIRFASAFRVAYYLPGLTSSIGAATVWMWLLNPQYGLVNQVLGYAGINGPAWLANSSTAMLSIVIVTVWQGLGGNMIIYLAGLKGIPFYLYESARLDGANRWQLFRHITWPMLRPTTFFVVTMSMIGAFQLFDQAFAMTQGGPGNATKTPVYLIYQSGFNSLQMGYAATMAFALFLIILVLSLLNMRLNRENTIV
jgi:multiple sugar transport system permease protein